MSNYEDKDTARHRIQLKLNDAITFLDPLLPLANCHTVEFITGSLWELLTPSDIKEEVILSNVSNGPGLHNVFDQTFRSIFDNTYLSSMSQSDKNSTENFPSLLSFLAGARDASRSCLSEMITWQEVQTRLELLGSGTQQSLYLDQFMTCKKAHEVEVMSQVVASLANACQVSHIVDVGSGKGYLSSMLALHHGLSVLGIDSSQSTSHGAAKRTKKLVRAWKGISRKEGLSSGSGNDHSGQVAEPVFNSNDNVDGVASNSQCNVSMNGVASNLHSAMENCKYKQATLFVTPHMNLLHLVQNYFTQSCGQDDQLALAGLHTCGDLAPTALRIFAANKHVEGLCNVGCCYHLLSEEFVLEEEIEEEESSMQRRPTKEYGFPISDYLRSKQYVLGRNARMLAAQSLERVVNNPNSHHWIHSIIEPSYKCCSRRD